VCGRFLFGDTRYAISKKRASRAKAS
jgi:hypothetical protein